MCQRARANQSSLAKPRDDIYGPYDASYLQSGHPQSHTQQPIVTGTSVLAVKFKDGVVIAADNLGTFAGTIISGMNFITADTLLQLPTVRSLVSQTSSVCGPSIPNASSASAVMYQTCNISIASSTLSTSPRTTPRPATVSTPRTCTLTSQKSCTSAAQTSTRCGIRCSLPAWMEMTNRF